jgi:hypothetical protein
MCAENIDIGLDQKVMDLPIAGKRRAVCLLPKEQGDASDPLRESKRGDEPKPN